MEQRVGAADLAAEKAPSLHEQRCRQVVETYTEIEDQLTHSGRKVPPEVIAELCSIALRLILVRP
jgi:hypothetical protein